MDEHGYYFCEDCKVSSGVIIDLSHEISIANCKKFGTVEIAYAVDNLRLRCRDCHRKHDGLDLKFER